MEPKSNKSNVAPKPVIPVFYRLKNPTVRQIGCPVCRSININVHFNATVVQDGSIDKPMKHPFLGPVFGSVFTVSAMCQSGHYFLIRMGNHRDVAITWADVPTTLTPEEMDIVDQGGSLACETCQEDGMIPQSPGDPDALELDDIEKATLSDNNYPSHKQVLTGMHAPMPQEELPQEEEFDQDMEDQMIEEQNYYGHGFKNVEKANKGYNAKLCHAHIDPDLAVEALRVRGVVRDVCLRCPNYKCPVYKVTDALGDYRRANENLLSNGVNAQGVHSAMPVVTAYKAKTLIPIGKTKTATTSLAKPNSKLTSLVKKAKQQLDTLNKVTDCPQKFTYPQAMQVKNQRKVCSVCPKIDCVMHPKNKPEII